MDEEAKKLLKEELEVNKENNKLLNKLVWYQKWARWFGAIKWIIVVGAAIGALYYLQPMIDKLWGTYTELLNNVSETSIRTLPGQ
ncbi:MAG: hypothetical protein WC640_02170 [Candidatus Paceibacterota bacterium]|jgi:hypothetical protein